MFDRVNQICMLSKGVESLLENIDSARSTRLGQIARNFESSSDIYVAVKMNECECGVIFVSF